MEALTHGVQMMGKALPYIVSHINSEINIVIVISQKMYFFLLNQHHYLKYKNIRSD